MLLLGAGLKGKFVLSGRSERQTELSEDAV